MKDFPATDGERGRTPAETVLTVPKWPVRGLLLALVLACLIPAMIGVGVLFAKLIQNGRAQLQNDTILTARALVQTFDSEVARAQVVAEALATSSALGQGDLAGFHRRAAELIDKEVTGLNVVLSDADGQMIVNTLRPVGDALPRHGNPAQIRRVFETGQPAISNVFIGAITAKPNFSLDVPVLANGQVVHVLSVAIVPQQVFAILSRQRFPDDWVASVFDGTGTLLTRSQSQEEYAGTKANPELIKRLKGPPEGAFESLTKEGVPALMMYSRSPVSNWTVAIGIPRQKLEAQLMHTVTLFGLAVAVLLGLGVGLAWWLGGRIARSVAALTVPAAALESGETVPLPQVYFREADEVGKAMAKTAQLLAQRTRELHQSNAELEERVYRRTAELEVANKELEAFTYSVSHDLRAPLRAIDGFSRKVSAGYGDKLDDEGRRQLQVVRDNAQRMGQLIDDLLAFSRMSRRDMARQALDMAAMAHGVADELRAAEPQRAIALTVGALPAAVGDAAMLRQVWVNLISNAIKFTGQREVAHIEIGGTQDDTEVQYWVKDDGAGFDMNYAGKLFGVFQRLHRQDEFEGTGVGLAIAQRVLQRHGGRIWGEGQPDSGAIFGFALPSPPRLETPHTGEP